MLVSDAPKASVSSPASSGPVEERRATSTHSRPATTSTPMPMAAATGALSRRTTALCCQSLSTPRPATVSAHGTIASTSEPILASTPLPLRDERSGKSRSRCAG